MPAETSTKAQVQAYRFGMRRLEHALATGNPYRRSLSGPRHGLSLLIGLVLATLVCAAFAVYGLIKPAPSIGNATVLVDSKSGGAYVVRKGVLYPATNLSSALLAATADSGSGSSASGPSTIPNRKSVTTATLSGMPKGQLLGIPGAPNALPAESALVAADWTVCDTSTVDPALPPSSPPVVSTTVVIGQPPLSQSSIDPATALLVTADKGSTYYLLRKGNRSRIDPRSAPLRLAFGMAADSARPISVGLLNAIPEAAPITAPTIAGQGKPAAWSSAPLPVGKVFQVVRASGNDGFYVALADGIEPVSSLFADVVRASTGTTAAIPTVPPAQVSQYPVSRHPLATDQFPTVKPTFFSFAEAADICLDWSVRDGSPVRSVYAATGVRLPSGAVAVPAPPGSAATTADAVYVAPQHGVVLGQSTTGKDAASGSLFLVTDQGLRYPVVSSAALAALGLGKRIQPAAPELLRLLPTGPTLDPSVAAQFYTPGSGGN